MILVFALLLAYIIGYLAQSAGICLVRGVHLARAKKPSFLVAILLAGTWTWIALAIVDYTEGRHHYQLFPLQASFIIGGFIFGIGATINGACSIGTINQFARGNSTMLFTLCGWALGGIIMLYFHQYLENDFSELAIPYGDPLKYSKSHMMVLFSLSVIGVVWVLFNDNKKALLLIALLGVLSECIFLIEPQWTPSDFTIGISYAYFFDSVALPSFQRLAIFGFVILGMMAVAIRSKMFQLQLPKITSAGNSLFGGLLMGVGGFMALGGNDKQLLIMLPTFSLSSLLTLLSMLLGIYVALVISDRINPSQGN